MTGAGAGRALATAVLVVGLGAVTPAAAAAPMGPALHGGDGSARPSEAGSHDAMDHGDGHTMDHGEDAMDHGDGHTMDHGETETSPRGHGDHAEPDAGTSAGHDAHGDAETSRQGQGDHDEHGGGQSAVSDSTRAGVLGGFGAVNAAAVVGAFLLRRRDRRTGRQARSRKGNRR